jgi:sulfate permease, SulP family
VLLALLVGMIQIGITLLRLGDLTRYVSHAVIVGFTVGAGFLIVLDQLKHLIGLHTRGEATDHFLKRFRLTLTTGGSWHWPTLTIGIGTIAVVVGIRRFNGRMRRMGSRIPIPQHLVATVVMATVVWGLD